MAVIFALLAQSYEKIPIPPCLPWKKEKQLYPRGFLWVPYGLLPTSLHLRGSLRAPWTLAGALRVLSGSFQGACYIKATRKQPIRNLLATQKKGEACLEVLSGVKKNGGGAADCREKSVTLRGVVKE